MLPVRIGVGGVLKKKQYTDIKQNRQSDSLFSSQICQIVTESSVNYLGSLS